MFLKFILQCILLAKVTKATINKTGTVTNNTSIMGITWGKDNYL